MSTAIAVRGSFGVLAPVASGSGSLSDLQHVQIPGQGRTTWSWSNILDEVVTKEIKGVCVAFGPRQYDLWPTTGEAKKNSHPYLRSHDNVTAHQIGDDFGDLDLNLLEAAKNPDGTYDCGKIEYFQWKEVGDRKIPPRAKVSRVLLVLTEGSDQPLHIRLPGTSASVMEKFFKQVLSAQAKPYGVVVSLGLEAVNGFKSTYSRIVPKVIAKLERDDAEAFRDYFDTTSPLLVSPLKRIDRAASDAVPF